MANGSIPTKPFFDLQVLAPSQAKATPTLTQFFGLKMFSAPPLGGPVGPIPRRKTQTIDIRM